MPETGGLPPVGHRLPKNLRHLAAQFTIELNGLRLFEGPGLYAEEGLVGNEFEIDIAIDYTASLKAVSTIDQTVNYVEVYQIIQDEFRQRQDLLETHAIHIADRLEKQFPGIESLRIYIRKLHPPISNFMGSVGVTYTRKRDQ